MLNKKYLAKGTRGIIYTADYNGEKVIVKEPNPKADINTIEHEAEILQKVNKYGIGPKFIKMENGNLIREFIDGVEILVWAENTTKERLVNVILKLLQECRTLDKMKLSKREMTRPYKHILIRNNKPVQIDFERALQSKKPKNVTQFCQWLTNSRMSRLLNEKNCNVNRDDAQLLAKSYKDTYNKKEYEAIVMWVKGW